MRELRFRAWRNIDGRLRRYVFSPFAYEYPDPDEPVFHAEHGVNDIRDFMPLADIIEQYTGLKDKNGKEIYEGDILGGIWESGFISWCEKCKQFQYHSAGIGCMACSGDVHWCEIVEDDGKLEVIGNIHENPELLEEE